MGSFLDKPKTEKTNEAGQGNDLAYGVGAMQGWRIEMEDAHTHLIGLPMAGFEDWSFFAVFDGHAGSTVSRYSSTELIHSILAADPELFNELVLLYGSSKCSSSSNLLDGSSSNISNSNTLSDTSNSQTNPTQTTTTTTDTASTNDDTNNTTKNTTAAADSAVDSLSISSATSLASATPSTATTTTNDNPVPTKPVVNYSEAIENRLKKAFRQGFLDLDEKMRHLPEFERGEDKSGSTAVACLISPTHTYLINCGDSRSLVCSENKVALCTYDHKPINPLERERIHNAGGSVMIQRVNGSLAVSRALGDFEYKCVEGRGPCEQLVSPEPEIYVRERCMEKDEFVVLACDGIWDVMSNEDLKEFIHSRLKVTSDLVKISNEVLDMCLSKGSRDNMSIVIVTFPGAPKMVPEEVEKDNICNEKIENRIKELIEGSNTRVEFSHVLQALSQERWEEFPSGGGFYAKQTLIEEIYNRLAPRNNEDESNSSSNCYFNSPL